jgi:hypothetical protein
VTDEQFLGRRPLEELVSLVQQGISGLSFEVVVVSSVTLLSERLRITTGVRVCGGGVLRPPRAIN